MQEISYRTANMSEELDRVIELVRRIGTALEDFARVDTFQELLGELGPIVQNTALDESYRLQLACSDKVWYSLRDGLIGVGNLADEVAFKKEDALWYVRTLRGLMLLMRNLSASNQELPVGILLQNYSIQAFLRVAHCNLGADEMVESYYTITVSFLHNVSKDTVPFDQNEIGPLMEFLQYPIEVDTEAHQELLHCHASFLLNLTKSADFLYDFFRSTSCDTLVFEHLLNDVANNHTELFECSEGAGEEDYDVTPMDAVILKIFKQFAVNESFIEYLFIQEGKDQERFLQIIKLLQIVVTSTETWSNFELTNIMAWCFPIFKRSAESTKQYFQCGKDNEQEARPLHKKLSITLDIMSKLACHEQVQKYLLSYGSLEALISLLGVLQKHLIRINFYKNPNGSIRDMKTTDASGGKVSDEVVLRRRVDYDSFQILPTNFPDCKLLIVEILTMLTYQRREVQDKIRELHGLELVLSNCVIDDNDPFIKERSVVCIKFLLQDNKPNQDFVAQLEAKKAVQDDTLSQAGYEVKIDSAGGLKLKAVPDQHTKAENH